MLVSQGQRTGISGVCKLTVTKAQVSQSMGVRTDPQMGFLQSTRGLLEEIVKAGQNNGQME